MRRRALLLLALFGVVTFVAALLSPSMLTWAVVHDLLRPDARPLATLLGWTPEVSVISVHSPSGPTRALLFRPQAASPTAGMVLVHGMIATGEEDWRLGRLAETLAAGGFAVLVPAVPGLKRGSIVEEDVGVVAGAVFHLREKVEGVDPLRVGVVGLSVGGGPALAAAARLPVAFAGTFGGYYDLAAVLAGLVEAGRTLEAELVTTDRWTFFAANSHVAADPGDRALLLRLAKLPPQERAHRVAALSGRLTPSGRALLELLTTKEPERVEELVERAGPEMARLRRSLSPRYFADRLTMKMFLVHGHPDPVIPASETRRLAAALPAGVEPTVAILPLYGHVDPRSPDVGPVGRWKALWRFQRLVVALLDQRP